MFETAPGSLEGYSCCWRERLRAESLRFARRSGAAILVTLLGAGALEAQFGRYTPPGDFPEERSSISETLQEGIEAARWNVGRFYLDPWVALRNVSYVDNQRDETDAADSRLTATLGAGVRLYRPVGSELTFAAHVLPEYTWWDEPSDRRQFNGRYGAGLFGDLGRTQLAISTTLVEEARFFSREIEEPINTREVQGDAVIEVELGAGFSVFGSALLRGLSFATDDAVDRVAPELLQALDRDEDIFRAGVKLALPRNLQLTAGFERSLVSFDGETTDGVNTDRSNRGNSPFVILELKGEQVYLESELVFRDIEPERDSLFVPYNDAAGRLRLGFRPTGQTELQLFANRDIAYSVQPEWSYFEDDSIGVGVRMSLGARVNFRVFVEQGSNDYIDSLTGESSRRDDFDAFGGEFRVRLGRLILAVGVTQTSYTSNISGFDRDVTTVRSGIVVGTGRNSPWA